MSRRRVLVVEDEPGVRELYTTTLLAAGFRVRSAATAAEARVAAVEFLPHVVLLDLGLAGRQDGFEVLRALRQGAHDPKVIIVTGRAGERDMVAGLRLGADEYAVKPVSRAVLLARVEAVLRRDTRGEAAAPAGRFRVGQTDIDLDRNVVAQGPMRVTLSKTESEVLARLLIRPGEPVSHRELLADVWGMDPAIAALAPRDARRFIEACLYRLRKKIGAEGDAMIVSVRGRGYRIGLPVQAVGGVAE